MGEDESSHLVDTVLDMADAEQEMSDGARLLVLAALEGAQALETVLEGDTEGASVTSKSSPDSRPDSEPSGAFIKAIQVRGFRGIGNSALLSLHASPGLTIIAGRNGSGKSSFAEAFELALTGNTYRWREKTNSVWSKAWRNLHGDEQPEIRIELAEEGVGTTTIGVDWSPDGELAERQTWIQRHGGRREEGVGSLGWSRAIELYQPTLSYDELGGLLEAGPSKLFDKIDAILGIEQVTDALRRLGDAVRRLEEPQAASKNERRELKKVLAALSDSRAQAAREILRRQHPDLDALQSIATGASAHRASELSQLKALAQLEIPDTIKSNEIARDLREAVADAASAGASTFDLALRRTALLEQALEIHRHGGDQRCPVCGGGSLDASWRERTEYELAAERGELKEHEQSQARLQQLRSVAQNLIRSVPEPREPDGIELASLPRAVSAWRRWSHIPADDAALADHLEAALNEVSAEFGHLRNEADQALASREDAWTPLALRLANWISQARTIHAKNPTLQTAQEALDFTQKTVTSLRDKKLEHLADKARDIWAALKQESNVNLGAVELRGRGNRRHVELRADVDGADAEALGVMSQGELHALALALFLPRATMSGSPFRFVLLDDPIQAMDPAKIDGFVQVLADLAKDRQVVVLSHDDRLPQTVRQLGIDARILQVTRDAKSAVEVVTCLDPAGRNIDDARAVALDPNVPTDVKARIVPGLCRIAVEACARDIYMARRFNAGDPRFDVEAGWHNARTTKQKLALALDDSAQHARSWLDARPRRRAAGQIIVGGVHEGSNVNLRVAVNDVEELISDLRAGRR